MPRNSEFQGGSAGSNALTPATCKHCGQEVSTNIARIGLDNGATYLFAPHEKKSWFHTGVSHMVLNGEATLNELKAAERKDPGKHEAEPADGRTHEQDYEHHAFVTRMDNIAKGIDPKESMELAMKPNTHTAYSIGKSGFGVV